MKPRVETLLHAQPPDLRLGDDVGQAAERILRAVQCESNKHVMGGTEIERIVQRDPPVDDLDRLHVDRPARTRALLLARVAPDECAEIPAPVRLAAADDPRARHLNTTHDDAGLHELANAVAERDSLDLNQRATFARDADVGQRDTPQQRSFKPPDRKRRGQVLVGLADNQASDGFLGPRRLQDREPHTHEDEHQRHESDKHLGESGRDRSHTT